MSSIKKVLIIKVIAAIFCIAVGVVSFFLIADKLGNVDFHADTISALDKSRSKVMELAAAAVASSSAITLLPGDVGTPIAQELAANDVDIISGMALGVDSMAHEGAVISKGKTYAVLGTGVNVCYPDSNFTLYNKLCNEGFGGVISEFPLGTNPLKFNFPIRNRIISGLADITVVIEARLKSGSLITATHAIEQGREVFALPGRITDCMSLGCNKLISDGAGIITSPTDILEALDLNVDKKIQVYNEKNANILAKNDKKVYSCLDLKPKYIDDIIKESALDISQVLSSLLLLELEGFIVQVSSNYYCKRLS